MRCTWLVAVGFVIACSTPEPDETGSWAPMASSSEASAVRGADAADYADGQLFAWGASYSRGFLYSEATDSWRAVSATDQPPQRAGASVVWANGRVLWWGTRIGRIYDPASDTWTAMSAEGAPSAREQHSAVWTGSKMIIWGGQNEADPRSGYASDGAMYDPVQNTWTPMTREGAPAGRIHHVTVWTGTRMLVWGGRNALAPVAEGAAYDPVADRWTPISPFGPHARFLHSAAWTGKEMFVWGGLGCGDPAELLACEDGARYDPALDRWDKFSEKDAPQARIGSTAVWSGREVLLWGGQPDDATGRRWEPIRNAWFRTRTASAPAGRGNGFAFWTGTRMLVWGGSAAPTPGGFYTP